MSQRKRLKIKSRLLIICLALACLLLWAGGALAYDHTNAMDHVGKGMDIYNKWKEYEDKGIPPGDGGSGPDYNPPGMPEVPTSCDGKQGCWTCYEQANKRLAQLRINFEKLRILYKETDDYTKAATALGDSWAGVSNLGGIEWTAQRLKILKSWKQFEAAYRKKYNQLVNALKDALQEVAKCEEQYFGVDDWYARYGYMFHSFMAMHYQK
jgi:hypothetical protein